MKLYYFQGVDELIEYPEGLVSMRACKVKPFPTCETCDKWKTVKCPRIKHEPIWDISQCLEDPVDHKSIWPERDAFCEGHPDFNPDNGGNK